MYTNTTGDYIGNNTIIAVKDTLLPNDIMLKQGVTFTKPQNISENSWSTRAMMTYGLPAKWIKSNFNLNTGFSYNYTPSLINSMTNIAESYGLSQGVGLTSNISEKLDFSLFYYFNYNIVNNTIRPESDNNYYTHSLNFRFNWIFWKDFTMNHTVNFNQYAGLSAAYNQQYLMWNASLGKKVFKNKGEFKLTVFDVLGQNNNISRNVSDQYIEDSRSNVLTRYVMFSFVYTIRSFKGTDPSKQNQDQNNPQRRDNIWDDGRPHNH
jgi:hypothetical protein